jgi:transposase
MRRVSAGHAGHAGHAEPPKLVAVALANKFGRIAWRLMVSGGVYNRPFATMPT